MAAVGGAAVEQLYNSLKESAKTNRKDRAYNISTRKQKQRPITAPVNRVVRQSKMRPSSSVSLPRTINPNRKTQEKKGYLSRNPRRIYYPAKVDTKLAPSDKLPLTSPVQAASAKRPPTAKNFPGASTSSNGEAEAKKSDTVKPPPGPKEIREFELMLERKHDALVGRIEQHLVNALCTGSATTKDDLQHMPNVVTEGMFTKIEQNQYSMLEQMAAIRRHSGKNETAVADLSRTVARLQKKVVTELLQFAAVMSPNNDAPAPRAKSNEDTKKQMEKMLQSVTKAVETSVSEQLEAVIDRKFREHLAPVILTKEMVKDLCDQTDLVLQRQAAIEASHEKALEKMRYLESMIRTLGSLAGEFIQMGVEDIRSTHRRSVDVIRSDIAKVAK